ncbi:GNAT family N-acetyltransferase [Peteryoungia ipomoeae]|uniref:GNAT family N-acetyltransferase n=1 Tax=Peteryoungia ipomoeae TaxID=1210932 RepID=A0A4S8P689_9HYPH|nr:GNAT family N-acetyltransferase [Peteryoungia ipomoeae]THV25777.1 GNAT family N-acetyltransferase [Peteryoungia ipomoeae]
MTSTAVRALTREELDRLLDWAADEGWNPGLADAAAFHAADPAGFLGCFVGGELAAGISAVAYDAQFGFIGLYICHPRFRGKGYGRKVWDAGMEYLGSRSIGLDGVPEQQAYYASRGFARLYETVRWNGIAGKGLPIASLGTASVRAITARDLPALSAFDRRHFPAPRHGFLPLWTAEGARDACVATTNDGTILGYAVLRRCRQGRKIGPLFAVDDETAELLLHTSLDSAMGDGIQIDVPDHQIRLSETLRRLGFEPGFTTARMYRGPVPAIALAGVYAITTLELG